MKAEWVNPFITNAISVIEQLAGIKFEKSELSVREETTPAPTNEISIIVGITGSIEGQVVYSFKESTAHNLAQNVRPNDKIEVDKVFIESSIAEIANIITGRATIELSGKDSVLMITPPTVVIGKDYTINFLKIRTISVNLTSSIGIIEVNIAMREKK